MSGIHDLPSNSSSLLDDPTPKSSPESSQDPYMGRVVKALGEMLPPGENIEHLTSQIFTTQQQFSSSSSQDSCKEADFSLLTMITPTIGVSPNVICRINDGCKLGQGGNSVVFEGTVLPTEPDVFLGDVKLTPSKPPRLAIKQGKQSFSPEKKLLQQIPGELDRPLATFRNSQTGAYQSVHNRFDTTLTSEIDYSTIQHPVLYAADQLSKAARGIEAIHTSGFIHGDIKGANIGVFRSGNVTITDFGTLWKRAEKRYDTCGTTLYLSPFVFEKAEDQVIRFGKQTIQADLFAFGRTILHDVILVIFKQMTEKVTSEIREIFRAFYPPLIPLEYVSGPDNKNETPIYWPLLMDQIKKLQEQHPDKVVLYHQKGFGITAHLYQIVMRAEEAAEKAKQLILLLSRCLPFEEVQRLIRLNDLARQLQQEDPAKIPDIQEVLRELESIHSLGNSSSSSSSSEKPPISLTKIDWTSQANPTYFALQIVKGALGFLKSIHLDKTVHRNIKGMRLEFSQSNPEKKIYFTGFENGMIEQPSEHKVFGTPHYLAPFIFKDFNGQVQRWGHQTKASDMFACGRTITKDLLIPLLLSLADFNSIPGFNEITQQIVFKVYLIKNNTEEYTEISQDLNKLQQFFSTQIFYIPPTSSQPHHRFLAPPHSAKVSAKIEEMINLLRPVLTQEEIDHLLFLNTLATEMQADTPEQIPSAEQAEILVKQQIASSVGSRKHERQEDAPSPRPIERPFKKARDLSSFMR